MLVYALSGLGKSWLRDRHPELVYDTDVALDAAAAELFPELPVSQRRRAWRALARSEPWAHGDREGLDRWARGRRRMVGEILGVLRDPRPRLVVTNLLLLPWPYEAYFGIELGRYEEHWLRLARVADNDQVEARNHYLEGFSPLFRLAPGSYLSDAAHVQALLDRLKSKIA